MGFTLWLAIALIAVGLIVWGYDRWKQRQPVAAAKAEARFERVTDELEEQFQTAFSNADEYVERANQIWPSIRYQPLFWMALASTSVLSILGIIGAFSINDNIVLQLTLSCAFVLAGLVQASLAVVGDEGYSAWYEFKKQDRKPWQSAVLVITLIVQTVGSVAGSAAVGSWLTASNEVQVSAFETLKKEKQRLSQQVSSLAAQRLNNGGDSVEALQAKAKRFEELAAIEEKTGKGPNYKQAVERATEYRVLADNALLEKKLGNRIAELDARLRAMADGGAKTSASPHGELFQDVTQGAVTREQVDQYGLSVF